MYKERDFSNDLGDWTSVVGSIADVMKTGAQVYGQVRTADAQAKIAQSQLPYFSPPAGVTSLSPWALQSGLVSPDGVSHPLYAAPSGDFLSQNWPYLAVGGGLLLLFLLMRR